jgi:hypothetical protein
MIDYLISTNWESAIRGMRNPHKSHRKSDSRYYPTLPSNLVCRPDHYEYKLGMNDLELAFKLIKAGSSHRKFLRQIRVSCNVTGSLKFMDQLSTYKHMTSNSTSQMHTLLKHNFTLENFNYTSRDTKDLRIVISRLNELRDEYLAEMDTERKKRIWNSILTLIPQSYLYTRTLEFNYETALNIINQRETHKLIEWRDMCRVLRYQLPYMNSFITKQREVRRV